MSKQRRTEASRARRASQPSQPVTDRIDRTQPDRSPAARRRSARTPEPGALRRWAFPAIFLVAGLARHRDRRPVAQQPGRRRRRQGDTPGTGRRLRPGHDPRIRRLPVPVLRRVRAFHRAADPRDLHRHRLGSNSCGMTSRGSGPSRATPPNAARCAGEPDKFWEYPRPPLRNQAGENAGAFAKDRLKAFGASLGARARRRSILRR